MISRAECPGCRFYASVTNGRFEQHADSWGDPCAGSGRDARDAMVTVIAGDLAQMISEYTTANDLRAVVLLERITGALRMLREIRTLKVAP